MRDVVWGTMLIILSVTAMIVYFWALFLSPSDVKLWKFYISEWAIIIPVLLFVYLFLFVIAWIGWAMATTPPTLPPKPEEEDKGSTSEEKQ
ncbi:MAG: transcriptional regulator [Candidatus Bathyarchaeia archaeon]